MRLDGRVQIPGEQDINVSFGPPGGQVRLRKVRSEILLDNVSEAVTAEEWAAFVIGQGEVANCQGMAIPMPEQSPITHQRNFRHRGVPQTIRNGLVG